MSKKPKRSPIHRAIEQLIMEDYEVFLQGSVATLMNGAVGIEMEARLLFCGPTHHMELIAPKTPKGDIVDKIKALMRQVEESRPKDVPAPL